MSSTSTSRRPRGSRSLRIGHIVASSIRNRWKFRLGRIDSASGSTMQAYSVDTSVDYINRVYNDFIQYGNLTSADITGKVVVELGPGDNIGVLLRFLAAGGQRAWAADKFYSRHDIEHERQIYLALRRTLSPEEQNLLNLAVDLEPALDFKPDRVKYFHGKGAQDFDQLVPANSVDLIVSRGVLQEVYEIDRAFAAMDRVLKPGGKMVHKIDLRDYGMFSSLGYHPREFLTISEPVYRWMAYDTDKPNRRMLNYYRSIMKQMGYQAQFYIAGIIQDGGYSGVQPEIHPHKPTLTYGIDYHDAQRHLINEIRPRLAPAYQDISDDELLASSVFLTAQKPA